MPYIEKHLRDKCFPEVREPATPTPLDVGELTYVLTRICVRYENYRASEVTDGSAFPVHAEVLAALEAAKLEFYRRVMVPHEKNKCSLNGDVYDE